MPRQDLRLAIQRQMIAYRATSTWATVASVGMPPSISRAGARTTMPVHDRQAWSRSPETASGSHPAAPSYLRRSPSCSPGNTGTRGPQARALPRSAAGAFAVRLGWHAAWRCCLCAARDLASPPPRLLWRSPARGFPNPVAAVPPADLRAGTEMHASQLQQQMAQPVILCLQRAAR